MDMAKQLVPILLLFLLSPTVGAVSMDERLNQLEADIEAKRRALHIPAVSVLIVDKNKVLFRQSFGVADLETDRSLTVEDYIRIGSITKTFTTLATLRLIQQGRLGLNDKLIDLAPELDVENPWHDTHPIRIAHLLEHTAGFNDLTAKEFDFNNPLSLLEAFKLSPGSRISRWPPGLHHSYSNISPGILSYVIEKVSGLEFEEYVQRAVLTPLNMQSATFFPEQRVLDRLISGYDSDRKSKIPYWHMTYRAFGALNLQLHDLIPFLQLFLNQGKHNNETFLDQTLMQRMEKPETTLAAGAGLEFGYGLNLYPYFHKGHRFYGHGGDADGYLSRFGYHQRAGLAYFVNINVFRHDDLQAIRALIEAFITEHLPSLDYPRTSLSKEQLNQFTGLYEQASWRFPNADEDAVDKKQVYVKLIDEELYLIDDQNKQRQIIPVNHQLMRFRNESVPTAAFIEHEGRMYFQTDFGNYQRLRH